MRRFFFKEGGAFYFGSEIAIRQNNLKLRVLTRNFK
jgi:hypothetical protein